MKKYSIVLALFMAVPTVAYSDKADGIMAQYRALEESIRGKAKSPEIRKKTLEENLVRAMRNLVVRLKYDEREALVKDLNAQSIQWENPTAATVFYVKYKTFLVRFDFARDPELYIESPLYEKALSTEDAGTKKEEPAKTDTKPADTKPGTK
ncbi:MAG: hypothetical protein HY042_00200 [Spirochaetia bacterium]|nr:hypothetical protein [Spirochaetia bacterium]